jgi:hypothetical protein
VVSDNVLTGETGTKAEAGFVAQDTRINVVRKTVEVDRVLMAV